METKTLITSLLDSRSKYFFADKQK